MSNKHNNFSLFQKVSIFTLVAVYLVILAGGVVRSTGSGMGCPDWPKCFGNWVPPTEASQLPENYQDLYAQKRKQKNERLATYLNQLGLEELSQEIHNELVEYREADFNVAKTWIEYVNRLLGVLVGVFIFLTLLFSIPLYKKDKVLFYSSLLTFLLVGFQGWIGSLVVSTNLLPGMVTIHMLLAIVIVFLLLYLIVRSFTDQINVERVTNRSSLNKILILTLCLFTIQIVLGTQVREGVDIVINKLGETKRGQWIEQLGVDFYIHRSFSALILMMHGYLLYQLRKSIKAKGTLYILSLGLFVVVVLEIVAGMSLAYLNFPAVMQPIHLLLAIVAIGIQFLLLLFINYEAIVKKVASNYSDKQLSYR